MGAHSSCFSRFMWDQQRFASTGNQNHNGSYKHSTRPPTCRRSCLWASKRINKVRKVKTWEWKTHRCRPNGTNARREAKSAKTNTSALFGNNMQISDLFRQMVESLTHCNQTDTARWLEIWNLQFLPWLTYVLVLHYDIRCSFYNRIYKRKQKYTEYVLHYILDFLKDCLSQLFHTVFLIFCGFCLLAIS